MKLKQVTHYPKSDPDCDGDYYDIELLSETGMVIVEYGDYYHEKGEEKMEGFIEGVEWVLGEKVKVERVDVADREG